MFGSKNEIKVKLVLDEFEFEFFEGSLKEMFKLIKQWKKLKPGLRDFADGKIQQFRIPYMPVPQPPHPQFQQQQSHMTYYPPQFYSQSQLQPQPSQSSQPVVKPQEVPDEIPDLNIPTQKPIIPPKGRTTVKIR